MADEWNSRSPLDEHPRWFQPPLHERIQAYVDEVNPETPGGRGPWMADLRISTPGDAGDYRACRITDFELTVDSDLDHREDLIDAGRYYLAGHGVDVDETQPDHETLETMPGPCIMCGEDEVHVTVERNPDGEIEETELKCDECGWRVSGGPLRMDEKVRINDDDQLFALGQQ